MVKVRNRAPRREDRPFHNIKLEYAENSLVRAESSQRVTKEDGHLIRLYIAELTANQNISKSRSNKLTYILIRWRDFIGPFSINTLLELYSGIEQLKKAKKLDGAPYTQNSLRDFLGALKRFYLWLIENSVSTILPKKLRKIKVPKIDTMSVTAGDLLTREEVKMVLSACQSSRDRALISVLYEGGFRIEEIGALQWGQVKFDEYGLVINVNLKTDWPRYVRLVSSTSYLAAWKADYPCLIDEEGLVFMSYSHQPITYPGVSAQVKKIAKRAGVTKHIHLHLFRHTRVTHMKEEGYSESTIKQMLWGNPDSNMLSTYSHTTNDTIDDEVLEKHGLHRPRKYNRKEMAARECPFCHQTNGPTHDYCVTCGRPLTEDARVQVSMAVEEIESHPAYKALMGEMKDRLQSMADTNFS